ncbi:MAG: fibronectin type III domain-containing protein [Bacteroidales bacterium]|nr:fibronectin type III domain-containing protein [Bacteroidales bacterium]
MRRIVVLGPMIAGSGTWVFQNGTHPVVEMYGYYTWDSPKLLHESTRTLVLKNCEIPDLQLNSTGKTFIESMVGSVQINNASHKLFARQLNTEGKGDKHNLLNYGGTAWVLGLKTEDKSKIVEVFNNGKVEVLGLLIYANASCGTNYVNPAFVVGNATSNASISVAGFRQRRFCTGLGYETFVSETRNGVTNTLLSTATPENGSALYAGYAGSASAPSSPSGLTVASTSHNRIVINYTDNANNEDGFRIERQPSGGAFTQIGVLGSNMTSFVDDGLPQNTTYTYRIKAYNVGG